MATPYNIGPVASQVVGVAGMGISLGILARTSQHVMDTMYGPPRHRSTRGRPRKYKSSKRRPSTRQQGYNPYQPKYRFRF